MEVHDKTDLVSVCITKKAACAAWCLGSWLVLLVRLSRPDREHSSARTMKTEGCCLCRKTEDRRKAVFCSSIKILFFETNASILRLNPKGFGLRGGQMPHSQGAKCGAHIR